MVADQLDVATVFVQEWRYLEGERRDEILAERRRYEERIRALFREGRELGELRSDLDDATAALLALSAANWAYTWLRPGATPTSSPTASTSLLWTACAATRLPEPVVGVEGGQSDRASKPVSSASQATHAPD